MSEGRRDGDAGLFAPERAPARLHGVLRSLASTTSLPDALRVIVGRGAHELDPVAAVIGRQVDRALVDVARWGSPLEIGRDAVDIDLSDRCVPWTDAVSLCEPVWVASADERRVRYPELAVGNEIESLAALPLVVNGTAIGALVIGCGARDCFDANAKSFLVLLADLCALMLSLPAHAPKQGAGGARIGLVGEHAVGTRPFEPRLGNQPRLTAREQEIAIALTQGRRSSAVAHDLGISIYTVRKHISAILRKYDVTSQSELIACIYRQSIGTEAESA